MYDDSQDPPLVGRAVETTAIGAALDRLAAGAGGILQVVGDPGIGKTRLLAHTRRAASARGCVVLSGRGSESEQRVPLQLVLPALNDLVGLAHADGMLPASLRGVAGAAVSGADWPQLDLALTCDVGRFRLFQAIRHFLAGSTSAPLVVLLDDVHWADPMSIDFLDFLSRCDRPTPVLLVLGHRPRQTPTRLRYALARGAERGTVAAIAVGPLALDETADLLGGAETATRISDLHRAAGGNPLYVQLLDRDAATVPPGRLESLLLGEVAMLGAREVTVATAAAVLRDPFDLDALTAVADLPPAEVEDALADLVHRDLVRPVPGGPTLVLRHAAVREMVYRAADPPTRLAAHRRALVELTRTGAPAAVRAWHIEHALTGRSQAHAAVLCEAARDVLLTDPAGAEHWLRLALQLLPATDEFAGRRDQVSRELAEALARCGRMRDSRDLLRALAGRVPPRSAEPSRLETLTGRELEIARLIGSGNTNRQIAMRLHLSVRTVEAHLAHAYCKLDVRSRLALATVVRAAG